MSKGLTPKTVRPFSLALLCALFLIGSAPAHAQDITTGLVGHWRLDETAGTTAADETGTNNGAMLDGITGAASSVQGKLDTALDFDGVNDHIDVGNDASINGLTTAMTVSAWVNIDLANPLDVIVSNTRDCCGTYNGFQLQAYVGNVFRFIIWNSTNTSLTSVGTFTPGTWTHVAGVYTGTQMILYINGVQDNFNGYSSDIGSPASFNTKIGEMAYAANVWPLDGQVDDLRIYNRALTATDIMTLYLTQGGPGTCNAEYEGVMLYNDTENVLQYCNSNEWIDMGPREAGGAGTCTNPDGVEGETDYNFTRGVLQYCNGANWIPMGPATETAPSTLVPTTGLVGHWRLDETSGTTANDSVGGNNGTMNGGLDAGTDSVAGQDGTALDFDGTDDRILFGAPAALEMGTNDMTISAWMRYDSTSTEISVGIATKGADTPTDEGYHFSYQRPSGYLYFGISDGATRQNAESNFTLGLNDDTWHHVAVTADRDGLASFYLDGAAVGTENISTYDGVDITNAGEQFIIGSWGNSNPLSFMGPLDDVRVYNRILSAAEIEDLYEGTGGAQITVGTCANPSGVAGEIVYNDDQNIMQFCNGSAWIGVR